MKKRIKNTVLLLSFAVVIILFQISCQKRFVDLPKALPLVTTDTIISITHSSAISGGIIMSNGNAILQKGVCWSINHAPNILSDAKTIETSSINSFISYLAGLRDSTIYYVRAYVTTSKDTVYGNELLFATGIPPNVLAVFDDIQILFPIGGVAKKNFFGVMQTDSSAIQINVASMKSSGTINWVTTPLTGRGVVWSTTHNPTLSLNTQVNIGNLIGPVNNINIAGLNSPGTTYYIREYAINRSGIVYGIEYGITTSVNQKDVKIGDYFKGGLVYYILMPGDVGYASSLRHGLIAGVDDVDSWYRYGYYWENYNVIVKTNANDTSLGSGKANTDLIIKAVGPGEYAASHCANLTLNGFHDWYLPSRDELKLMYFGIGNGATGTNKDIGRLASHGTITYWSSSEVTNLWAYFMGFRDGTIGYSTSKINRYLVCPVRSF